MKTMHIRITFLEPILGTWPADPQVAEKYIASKAPDAATITDEIAATSVEEVTEKAMTIFPRDEGGQPVLYDYQIKGFFKDACGMLARAASPTSCCRTKRRQSSALYRTARAALGMAELRWAKAEQGLASYC